MSTESTEATTHQLDSTVRPDFTSYDRVVLAFSGGKDSLACLLELLEQGCPASKIELWHHDIDGKGAEFMDWACTPAYCRAVAAAFGVPIYFSWREGGFEREMLKKNEPSQSVKFEAPGPDGLQVLEGRRKAIPSLGTRLQFPQVTANLAQRWCSSVLKIEVAAAAINNQPRFHNSRTLFITGERAEESKGRAGYAEFETHRNDARTRLKKHIDQWRPVHKWSTAQVWAIIAKWKAQSHPCYRLGFGRCSCAGCIFGNPNQWASLKAVSPSQFDRIASYEDQFGKTIHRKHSVETRAAQGCPYPATSQPDVIAEAQDPNWDHPVFMEEWTLPAGAFAELDGPC